MSPHAESVSLPNGTANTSKISGGKGTDIDILSCPDLSAVRASLAALHERDELVTSQLRTLLNSQASLSRDLARLDTLRAHLSTQITSTRALSHGMLDGAASTASSLSMQVSRLDLEKTRVQETLHVVEQVAELKACVLGAVGSMGAPQDWETAAGYLHRASKVPKHIITSEFACRIVPTVEIPDAPEVTLENARESLCGLFVREFEKAAGEGDGGRVTRFFKLFPLIGRSERGLDAYGRYVCGGVSSRARQTLRDATGRAIDAESRGEGKGMAYATALIRLFEHIAQIVEHHGPLVERHYGLGSMERVIQKLQQEADVQGGMVVDTWGDERGVERRLVEVKSYPFSFLVQSFLPGRDRPNRTSSPAVGAEQRARMSEDEAGVDMKEVDGLLNETALMLGRWALYGKFIAGKCRPPDLPPTAISPLPDFLLKSPLRSKITQRILQPHTQLSTFFFRRSVEKAFQLDESPASQLSLNPSNPLPPTLSQPYVISAVDDVMYIVSTVLSRAISTQQQEVISGVVPAVGRVLGADFVGCVQRRMRDESYPRAAVAGGLPSEAVIIQFIVLINSLDVSNEYMGRIVAQHLTPATEVNGNGTANGGAAPVDPFLKTQLEGLKTSFEHKLSELRTEALTLLFHNVVKLRLRSIISDTFRDAVADYSLSPAQLSQLAQDMEMSADDDAFLDIVERKFESGWAALMGPLRRIMTPGTYAALLSATAEYLSKVLEKKVWSWEGKCSPTGAVRLERDVSAVVNVVCKGSYGLKGRWFERVGQVGMVANLEEEEWEVMRGGDGGEEAGVTWVLSREERERARRLVRV